jgi:hypothetical protein
VNAYVDQFKALTDTKEASSQLMYWLTAIVTVDANDPYRGETVYTARTIRFLTWQSPSLKRHACQDCPNTKRKLIPSIAQAPLEIANDLTPYRVEPDICQNVLK